MDEDQDQDEDEGGVGCGGRRKGVVCFTGNSCAKSWMQLRSSLAIQLRNVQN